MRRLLVETLRLICELDRAIDKSLSVLGVGRRFYSTKGQDRWIVERALPSVRSGYFVEVGAADGRTHSNTYSLERDYGWVGLAIEANPNYIPALTRNRTCRCVHACVDGTAQEVEFLSFGHLGGIIAPDTDNAREKRRGLVESRRDRIARVRTSTLLSVLEAQGAPKTIDYLSIDVEGAEHRILANFPFYHYRFRAITVERPTTQVHALLRTAGYVLDRVHLYDGFYVSRDIAAELGINERPFQGMAPKNF